jgi:hypothetical protein
MIRLSALETRGLVIAITAIAIGLGSENALAYTSQVRNAPPFLH